MTIDITMIIKAFIDILIAVITIIFNIWLKEKIDAERYEKIKNAVSIAVKAAEQIFRETGAGAKKKAYVIEFLREKGFVFDEDYIDAMIEAAVLELNKA